MVGQKRDYVYLISLLFKPVATVCYYIVFNARMNQKDFQF